MNKESPKLFPLEYHTKDFSFRKYESNQDIPVFKFPVGFHGFCLYNLANFFEEKGTKIFNNFQLEGGETDVFTGSQKEVDFTHFFNNIVDFFLHDLKHERIDANDFLTKISDRSPNIMANIVENGLVGFAEPIILNVPKGKEDGIVYSLSASRNVDVSQIFLVDTSKESIPHAVSVTAAQPHLFNDVVETQFPLLTSIEKKRKAAISILHNLSIGQFELQWAIVTLNGIFSLIICRSPFFIRISDNSTLTFNSLDDALLNARVLAVSYRYAEFSSNIELRCAQSVNILHNECIEGDKTYFELARKKFNEEFDYSNLYEFIERSIDVPAYYFRAANYGETIAQAASIFVQYPNNTVSASTIVSGLLKNPPSYDQTMNATNEYYRFLFWVRSITTAIKTIISGDLDRLLAAFRSCFYSLPGRVGFLVTATIRLIMNSLNIFRKRRGMNEKFSENVLLLFAHALGTSFADVLGFKKYDLFKSSRTVLVTQEACAGAFVPLEFERASISPERAIAKLKDAIEKLKAEKSIDFIFDSSDYELDPEYIEFLKIQLYEPVILQ